VVAVVLRAADADVDDAALHAAVLGAEIARVEVDLREQLGGDDAREPTEVVDERHRGAVDEGLRLGWAGATHEQDARDRGRPRHAGQVRERAERVAVGAGDAIDLALRECAFDDLARWALAAHGDRKAVGGDEDAVLHRELLARLDRLGDRERVEAGGLDDDVVVAGLERGHDEAAVFSR
jgi:hypothetical protein